MKQFVRELRVCGGRNSSSTTMSPELLTNRGKVPSFLKEKKKTDQETRKSRTKNQEEDEDQNERWSLI